MSSTQISCPSCHAPISLDDAFASQMKSTLQQEWKKETEAAQEKMQTEFEQKLREERETTERRLRSRLEEDSKRELSFLQERLEEEQKKRKSAEDRELDIRKRELALEEASRSMTLEMERKLEEERKSIREKTESQLIEQQRLKDLQKDKMIGDLRKALEDAQRKANQGSQQTQGEVQELEMERLLTETFRDDIIEPVGKGVTGADIRQIVRSSKGTICGIILWESKQTKSWSEGWVSKLKSDLRAEHANIPVIVTTAYTESNWCGLTLHDGVWVCNFSLFMPLAISLRKQLLEVGREKAMAQNKGEKADLIYGYVTSNAFRQQMEALVELYSEAHSQIGKERAAMEKIWKMREGQAQRLMLSLGNIYGNIQGLAGSSAVPELTGLSLLEPEEQGQLPL